MKLKILTAVSLIAFFVFMTGVFTAGIVGYYKNSSDKTKQATLQDINNKLADAGGGDDPSVFGALTEQEVAKHDKADDCWLIIDQNVYNVSSFVRQHPGGSKLVEDYCGKDATQAFASRDKNPPENHSNFAHDLLRTYYIGPLGRVPEKTVFPGSLGNAPAGQGSTGLTTGQNVGINTTTSGNTNLVIDQAEVSKHSTLQDCWLIISGNVYNITSFVASHPGGEAAIAPWCGKDSTNAYKTKGGAGNDHSSYAYSLLGNYLIAKLGSSVAVNTTTVGTTTVPTAAPTAAINAQPTSAPQQTQTSNLTLSNSEIATHNTLQNCWIIISGKVYDVTKFISQHPGGVTEITNWCGKDATNAFQTKGGRGSNHSSYAYSLLNNYYIGVVGSSVQVNSSPTPASTSGGGTTTNSTPTQPPSGSSCPSDIPQSICSLYSGSTVTKKSGHFEDNGSWEGEVNVNGSCRHIKTNSSGSITSNESC